LKYIQAGPGYYGAGEEFDKKCLFGNLVDMNLKQAMVLNKIVRSALTPMMRYACTMKYETVIPIDCMDEYLLRFMFEPIMVVINCTSSYNQAYAKMEYDQPTGYDIHRLEGHCRKAQHTSW
jgi:hypothetical protein